MEGFERGRNLDKVGQHAQDTAELFFDDVRVPKENLLGEEGAGFVYLMTNLSQERLSIAVSAAQRLRAWSSTTPLSYAKERTAFGKPIGKFQHNRFVIAEMATEAHIARVFVDDCIKRHVAGELDTADRVDGEVVDHRAAEEAGRPGRADARRVRLHDGVPDRPGLREQPGRRRSTAARPRSRRRSSAAASGSEPSSGSGRAPRPCDRIAATVPDRGAPDDRPTYSPNGPGSSSRSPAAPSSTRSPTPSAPTPTSRRTPTSTTCPRARRGAP